MGNPNQMERDEIRSTAEEIVARLQTDPAFAEQVRADPTSALTSAGLPQEAVTEFLRVTNSPSEVSGHMLINPADLRSTYLECGGDTNGA